MNQISAFGMAMLFITGGMLMLLAGMAVSALLRPNRPNAEKLTSYECGEDSDGASQIQYNMRFYVMALVFLIFDVEIIFLFPWATVFTHPELMAADPNWALFSFVEVLFFTLVLVAGLVWLWAQGDLDWTKPQPILPVVSSAVPMEMYTKLNAKYQRYRPVIKSSTPETEAIDGTTG
jgi:NADH-quinone oxidoreductase subunit A